MLKSIKINNFKSVQDLEIELGRVNVFIGENGCGKTSILEAVGVASAAFSNKLDQEFLVSRGIRVTDSKLMKSAFNPNNSTENITFTLLDETENHLHYDINYVNKNLSVVSSKANMDEKTEKLWNSHFPAFLSSYIQKAENPKLKIRKKGDKDTEEITAAFDHLLDAFAKHMNELVGSTPNADNGKDFNFDNFLIYTPENYFLRRFEEEGQIHPLGVRGEGLFKHLLELFKDQPSFANDICNNLKLINWFEGLDVPTDLAFGEMRLDIKDRFIKDTIAYFDQRSANEGFLYLLFYFTLFLSNETPGFFAIDNIDNALNPKLCKELIERLTVLSKENEKQVILTTHNPAILDGLDLNDDEQRLFVIYRNADGHTKAKRVKAPKPVKGVETVRLSEAFIRGYIGGLPKNF